MGIPSQSKASGERNSGSTDRPGWRRGHFLPHRPLPLGGKLIEKGNREPVLAIASW